MSSKVDWEDQRAFLAVLEEGSLSAAARRLNVTQPTVRARIAALERGLGTALFSRSVRGLVPTAEARALAASARAMARASEAFVRAASGPSGDVAGVVRLGVSEFVGVEVLPAMLRALRRDHPRLAVEIEISNASADLLEQAVDVAVRMHPPRQGALIARKVPTIPLGLFASVDYLAARGEPRSLAELADHDLIGPDRSPLDLEAVERYLPGLDRARFAIRVDNHPAQLAAARAGLGIAVAQRAIGLADPRLRPILPGLALPGLETWIVTHEDLRDLPRVRTLFDHLVAAFEAYQ